MTRLTAVLAAAVAVALTGALAGCGSSSSSDSTATPAPAATTPAATAPAAAPTETTDNSASAAAGAVKVTMKDIAFNPKTVTVPVGGEVEWINEDDVDHNVVADSGADFKSDNFGKGGTYKYSPTKAGTITYECTLHPGMTGTIQVTG